MLKSRRRAMASWGQNNTVGVIAAVVIVLAIGLMVWQGMGGGTGGNAGPITLKCANPKCDWQKEMSQTEAMDMFFPPKPGVPEDERFMMAGPDQREVAKCPKCGEMSVFRAEYCKQCEKYFVPTSNMYPMNAKATTKCPDCGFDPAAERLREWKEKHGK